MNIHIELVKKWLADNDSVTQQELEDNCAAAATYAADAAYAEYSVKRYEELANERTY